MREIKFRAWIRKDRRMVDKALFIENVGLGDGTVMADEKVQEGQELDWMQYTGLKDKNEVEIYEGDILKFGGEQGRVYWKNETAQFLVRFEETGLRTPYSNEIGHSSELEIIGNIYSNPELIKETPWKKN